MTVEEIRTEIKKCKESGLNDLPFNFMNSVLEGSPDNNAETLYFEMVWQITKQVDICNSCSHRYGCIGRDRFSSEFSIITNCRFYEGTNDSRTDKD